MDTQSSSKHIDQGMSFDYLHVQNFLKVYTNGKKDVQTRWQHDLNILRNYAWNKGIKSVYYVRTFTENNDLGPEVRFFAKAAAFNGNTKGQSSHEYKTIF